MKLETPGPGTSISAGEERERYYCPFPGLDAYPLLIQLSQSSAKTITYTVRQVTEPTR